MAGKQLSIIISAVDQSTGTLRTIGKSVLDVGDAAGKAGEKTKEAADKGGKAFEFLKKVIEALAIVETVKKITEAFNETAKTLVEVGNASKTLNIPVEALSELRYAAKLSDMDFQGLAASLATASKNIAQFALTGGGRAADAVKRLNVDLRGSDGALRSIGDLLPEILDNLAKADPTERIYLAQKVFGEGGDKFLRFVSEGTNRLRVFNDEAHRLGVVFTPEQVEAAEKYRQSVMRVSEAWLGLKAKLVEGMGPEIAGLLNKVASGIAAVPEIVSTLVGNIRKAVGDGPESVGLKLKFVIFGEQLVGVLVDVLQTGGVAAATAMFEGIRFVMESEGDKLVQAMMFDADVLWKWIKSGFTQDTKEFVTLFNQSIADVGNVGVTASEAFFNKANSDAMVAVLSSGFRRLKADMSNLGDSADGIMGISEALAKTSLAGLEAKYAIDKFKIAVDQVAQYRVRSISFDDIKNGAHGAATDLVIQANQVTEFVKKSIVSVSESLSSGLATAIIDVVSGTKSLEKAFKDLAASTLKQVAQMILQFEILRLVAGIAGSLAAPSGGSLGGFGGTGAGNGGGAVLANKGGLIMARPTNIPVFHFAGGGYVPGLATHRDTVPAMLTPGERVISERGVNATSSSVWDYANAGGRVVPAGSGGGSVNVYSSVSVSVSGGSSIDAKTLAEIQRASTDGVLAALEKSPAKQQRLARMVRNHV